MANNFNINIQTLTDKAKQIKSNKELSSFKTIALILEKLCNESLITNEFLDSITFEDINQAYGIINDYNNFSATEMDKSTFLITEMQKNTFLETIIEKTKCLKTDNTVDFF